jgi:hypothetical protein
VSAITRILENQTAREVNGMLHEFVDPVLISGLTPSPTLLLDALDDPSCPKQWSQLEVGSSLRCVERNAKPVTTTDVLVECVYRRTYLFPLYLRSGTGALETIETSRDSQDPDTWNPILVGPATKQQCGVVQAQMAQQVLRFERIVELDDPAVDQRTYLNHVNSNFPWYGLAAGQWLCTKFDYEFLALPGVVTPAGISPAWSIVMEFTSKKYGWQPMAEWIDPETGKPPSNTTSFVEEVAWYETADFEPLELGGV